MTETWIKLYRKAMEHPVFLDESAWRVWTWILMSVDYETGEMTFGRFKDADALNISPSKFRHIIDRLKNKYDLIETTNQHSHTKLLVKNWRKYQAQSDTIMDNSKVGPQLGPQIRPQETEHAGPQATTEEISQQEQNLDYVLEPSPQIRPQENIRLGPQPEATNKATNQEYKNNKEVKKERSTSSLKDRKPPLETDDFLDPLIQRLLDRYNSLYGTKFIAIKPLRANFKYWYGVYQDIEFFLKAIENISIHHYWQGKMTVEMLLRKKNQRNEDVDYIGELFNYTPRKEEKDNPQPSRPRTNFTEERLAEEALRKDTAYGQTAHVF